MSSNDPQNAVEVRSQESAPSLGQVLTVIENLYREGKLEILSPGERRAQAERMAASGKAHTESMRSRLKGTSL